MNKIQDESKLGENGKIFTLDFSIKRTKQNLTKHFLRADILLEVYCLKAKATV